MVTRLLARLRGRRAPRIAAAETDSALNKLAGRLSLIEGAMAAAARENARALADLTATLTADRQAMHNAAADSISAAARVNGVVTAHAATLRALADRDADIANRVQDIIGAVDGLTRVAAGLQARLQALEGRLAVTSSPGAAAAGWEAPGSAGEFSPAASALGATEDVLQ